MKGTVLKLSKTSTTVMGKAVGYLGTAESPANSNNVIFNTHYYGKAVSGAAYPWCCAFVWDCFRLAGASDIFFDGNKTAYCPNVETWGKKNNLTVDKTQGKYGDIVLFDFKGTGVAGHIGFIVSKNADGTYKTIEGNTSSSSDDNGGKVMYRTRSTSVIRCIIRPKYAVESSTNKTSVVSQKPVLAKATLKKGMTGAQVLRLQKDLNYVIKANIYTDGVFGEKTETALKNFQKKYKLNVDGVYGSKSEAKMKSLL